MAFSKNVIPAVRKPEKARELSEKAPSAVTSDCTLTRSTR